MIFFLKLFNGKIFEVVVTSECDDFVGRSDNLVYAIYGIDRSFSSAKINGFLTASQKDKMPKVFSSTHKSFENHAAELTFAVSRLCVTFDKMELYLRS